jgi:SAM-dependent methyltransferase
MVETHSGMDHEVPGVGLIKSVVHRLGRKYVKEIRRREWRGQKQFRISERPVELSFALREMNKLPITTVLDVGSGTSPIPAVLAYCGYIVTAIDNVRDYWPKGMHNPHFHVVDDDIRHPRINQKFDAITCISVLEHIPEFLDATRGFASVLGSGGYLILTFPYNERRYCPDVYRAPESSYGKNNPYICQSYSRAELDLMIGAFQGRILAQEYWKVFSGELWAFGQRLERPQLSSREDMHQLACLVIQKTGSHMQNDGRKDSA